MKEYELNRETVIPLLDRTPEEIQSGLWDAAHAAGYLNPSEVGFTRAPGGGLVPVCRMGTPSGWRYTIGGGWGQFDEVDETAEHVDLLLKYRSARDLIRNFRRAPSTGHMLNGLPMKRTWRVVDRPQTSMFHISEDAKFVAAFSNNGVEGWFMAPKYNGKTPDEVWTDILTNEATDQVDVDDRIRFAMRQQGLA